MSKEDTFYFLCVVVAIIAQSLKFELHLNTHKFSNSPNGLNKSGQLTEVPPELIGLLQQAYITPLQAVNTKQKMFPPFPLFEGIYISCIAFYFSVASNEKQNEELI